MKFQPRIELAKKEKRRVLQNRILVERKRALSRSSLRDSMLQDKGVNNVVCQQTAFRWAPKLEPSDITFVSFERNKACRSIETSVWKEGWRRT